MVFIFLTRTLRYLTIGVIEGEMSRSPPGDIIRRRTVKIVTKLIAAGAVILALASCEQSDDVSVEAPSDDSGRSIEHLSKIMNLTVEVNRYIADHHPLNTDPAEMEAVFEGYAEDYSNLAAEIEAEGGNPFGEELALARAGARGMADVAEAYGKYPKGPKSAHPAIVAWHDYTIEVFVVTGEVNERVELARGRREPEKEKAPLLPRGDKCPYSGCPYWDEILEAKRSGAGGDADTE
jgi:hypothetical protein